MRAMWRRVAAILLLVVLAHAGAPVGQPLDRQSGSAFSSATVEVSLKVGTRAAVARQAEQLGPPEPSAVAIRRSAELVEVSLPHSAPVPDGTGPPAAQTSFSPVIPTGPPAA